MTYDGSWCGSVSYLRKSLRTSRINAPCDSYCDSQHCSYSIARPFVPLHIEQSSLMSHNVHDAATEDLQCAERFCMATRCGGLYYLSVRHTRLVINAF